MQLRDLGDTSISDDHIFHVTRYSRPQVATKIESRFPIIKRNLKKSRIFRMLRVNPLHEATAIRFFPEDDPQNRWFELEMRNLNLRFHEFNRATHFYENSTIAMLESMPCITFGATYYNPYNLISTTIPCKVDHLLQHPAAVAKILIYRPDVKLFDRLLNIKRAIAIYLKISYLFYKIPLIHIFFVTLRHLHPLLPSEMIIPVSRYLKTCEMRRMASEIKQRFNSELGEGSKSLKEVQEVWSSVRFHALRGFQFIENVFGDLSCTVCYLNLEPLSENDATKYRQSNVTHPNSTDACSKPQQPVSCSRILLCISQV